MKNKQSAYEQQIRGWVRQILLEATSPQLVLERGNASPALYNIFIEPFMDVLRVGKMVFKDVLTHAKFTFDMLVTFDPWKINDIKKNYKKRKDALKEEWKDVMKPTYDALGAESVHFAAMVLNPAVYLTAIAGASAVKTTAGVVDVFRDAGFGAPSSSDKEEKDLVDPAGLPSKILKGLKKVFFLEFMDEAHIAQRATMYEQDGGTSFDVDKAIISAMEELGITEDMKIATEDLMQDTQVSLNEVYELVENSAKVIGDISSAETLDELLLTLDAARGVGLDLGGPSPANLRSKFDADVNMILNDEKQREDFLRSLAKSDGVQLGDDDELTEKYTNMTDDILRDKVAQVLYVNSSQSIREAMNKSSDILMTQVEELIADLRPPPEAEKSIKATPVGREYLALFDNLIARIEDLL